MISIKMDVFGDGVQVILTAILACLICSVNSDEYIKDPSFKITYTNQFKFELKDVGFIAVVRDSATNLGFVFKGQIVAELFLFIRDDVSRFSDVPYSVKDLTHAEDAHSQYVVSIEQDYERQWIDQMPNFTSDPLAKSKFLGLADTKLIFSVNFAESILNSSNHRCKESPVNVAFIDAGFELKHRHLRDSADFELSYNFLEGGHDVLPPFYDDEDMKHYFYEQLSHGTRCMGRVGAKMGDKCDGGVAPHVKLVGLKALDFDNGLSDVREAEALLYRHDKISIFSCSYGIKDNMGFFSPKPAARKALHSGATKSRDCRGVVYVFPSGNGNLDNCNADGYANSVDTITIAYVDKDGQLPKNIEICPAAIAATVGQGSNTTDLDDRCSSKFQGSSASSAVAAGYFGELRFVRPCLSKRDIEHIMVTTAVLGNGISWRTNGAGHKFNDQIGFGQLNLGRMKKVVRTWRPVPERHKCVIIPDDTKNKHITGTNWIDKNKIPSNACRDTPDHVQYLEHVQVSMTLQCSNISAVAIQLVSPAGTVSNILTPINMTADRVDRYTYLPWTFMSANFWHEQPSDGPWLVKVIVDHAVSSVGCEYSVDRLVLYGTETDPRQGGGLLSCHSEVDKETSDEGLTSGAIAGIVSGVIAAVLLGGVILYKYRKKLRTCSGHYSRADQTDSSEQNGSVSFHSNSLYSDHDEIT